MCFICNNYEITIRDAIAEDMPEVLNLIKELATFEKEADAVEVTVEDLVRDGFGEETLFHCFVGELHGKIVGMALGLSSIFHLERPGPPFGRSDRYRDNAG